MAFIEDSNDVAHQAAIAESHRDGSRALELAAGPDKIPVDGAVELLRRDPFTQGPRLFAKHCFSCHRFNGHDGRGSLVYDNGEISPPTAADLGNFASRDWMRAVVVDYSGHFADWKNAGWFADAKAAEAAGEDVEYLDPDNSEMADWSGDAESLKSPENAENLNALIEFLYAEAQHGYQPVYADEEYEDLGKPDATLVEKGRAVAVEGAWAGALEGTSCADCHTSIGQDFVAIADDDADGYPTMAKYGSAAWLKDFIRNPGAARHYGSKNAMKAYSTANISDQDLDLLVRWMTSNYYPTEVQDYPNRLDAVNATVEPQAESSPEAESEAAPEK